MKVAIARLFSVPEHWNCLNRRALVSPRHVALVPAFKPGFMAFCTNHAVNQLTKHVFASFHMLCMTNGEAKHVTNNAASVKCSLC